MAKPLALRHGRRIASARFSARLISYIQPVSDITPVQEDVCSYAATPRPPERGQGYYSLPVMKLDVGIAVELIYSHSIVAGGLLVISYTILLMCPTSFTILVEALSRTSYGILAHWAVIKSVVDTALKASV